MTERNPPVWMQTGTYSAADDRLITGLLSERNVTTAGALSGIEGGVVPPLDQLKLTVSGSGMGYTISSGTVIIPSAGTTPPGAYICYNDGSFTSTLDIEGSANPRLDLIVADVDDQSLGDATSTWQFRVVKGTPGPNPVAPAWIGNQIPIAVIKVVPASQNGGFNKLTDTQVTDLRRFSASQGGVHLTWNGVPNPTHSPGRLVYNASLGTLYADNGTDLKAYYSFDQWIAYMAAYRPIRAESGSNLFTRIPNSWINVITLNTTGYPNQALPQITTTSPSGMFRVDINSYIIMMDNQINGNYGHMGVRVLNSVGATVVAPSVVNGIANYTMSWDRAHNSHILTGLPTNEALTFRLEVYRETNNPASGLMVQQPVLTVQAII